MKTAPTRSASVEASARYRAEPTAARGASEDATMMAVEDSGPMLR